MAATKYRLGLGSVLSVSVDGGTTYIPVKQLKTVTFAGYDVSFDDITNMDSPGGVKEVAPTLSDPGTAEIQGVFLDSDPGQLAVNAANVSMALLTCKLQMAPSDGETTAGFKRVFTAYVQKANHLDAQFDKSATFSATLKITGPYTDTPGS